MDELDTVAAAMNSIKAEVVFEFGAYDGLVTVALHQRLKHQPKKWFAWECDPRNIAMFKANKSVPPYVELVECAVSNRDGTTTMCLSSDDTREWTASSSILGPSEEMANAFNWLRYKKEHEIEVRTRSLDSFCKERGIGKIDFIWSDIEGAERRLIEGGREMLKHTKYFYFEFWMSRIFKDMWILPELTGNLPGWQMVKKFTNDILMVNTQVQ